MLLAGFTAIYAQAQTPAEAELTLFDFLGDMVAHEQGWVDPLDLLDESLVEEIEAAAANTTDADAAEVEVAPVTEVLP